MHVNGDSHPKSQQMPLQANTHSDDSADTLQKPAQPVCFWAHEHRGRGRGRARAQRETERRIRHSLGGLRMAPRDGTRLRARMRVRGRSSQNMFRHFLVIHGNELTNQDMLSTSQAYPKNNKFTGRCTVRIHTPPTGKQSIQRTRKTN